MSIEHTARTARRQGLFRHRAGGLLLDHERRLAPRLGPIRHAERRRGDEGERGHRRARLVRCRQRESFRWRRPVAPPGGRPAAARAPSSAESPFHVEAEHRPAPPRPVNHEQRIGDAVALADAPKAPRRSSHRPPARVRGRSFCRWRRHPQPRAGRTRNAPRAGRGRRQPESVDDSQLSHSAQRASSRGSHGQSPAAGWRAAM